MVLALTKETLEELIHGRAVARDDDQRCDLVQRNENEGAFGQARVRNLKI
jgi:hypothetical protein